MPTATSRSWRDPARYAVFSLELDVPTRDSPEATHGLLRAETPGLVYPPGGPPRAAQLGEKNGA